MEEQTCALARELHIRTIGSYRPDRFALTWRAFTDDHHVTRSAVRRYWRNGCITQAPANLHAAGIP